jgi:hypothetical protein
MLQAPPGIEDSLYSRGGAATSVVRSRHSRAALFSCNDYACRYPMPPPASPIDWEMNLVMPLGVLANQLVKIEGDLRFLSIKAAERSGEDTGHSTKSVDTRLEVIHEVMGSIYVLLAKIQADLHPKGFAAQPMPRDSDVSSTAKIRPELDD